VCSGMETNLPPWCCGPFRSSSRLASISTLRTHDFWSRVSYDLHPLAAASGCEKAVSLWSLRPVDCPLGPLHRQLRWRQQAFSACCTHGAQLRHVLPQLPFSWRGPGDDDDDDGGAQEGEGVGGKGWGGAGQLHAAALLLCHSGRQQVAPLPPPHPHTHTLPLCALAAPLPASPLCPPSGGQRVPLELCSALPAPLCCPTSLSPAAHCLPGPPAHQASAQRRGALA
jgi:hypothetical protein